MSVTFMNPTTSKKIEIFISKEEINNGLRNKSDGCPVALALKKSGYTHINVWTNRISFLNPKTGEMIHRNLPANLQDFIVRFDTKQKVSPHAFYI